MAEKLSTCPLCELQMRGCTLNSHLEGHARGGWTHQQEILDKYNEGWTFEHIIRHYHVSRGLVCKILNNHGIPVRQTGTHADEYTYTCPHCGRSMRGSIFAKHLRSHEEADWETEQDIVDLYEYRSVAWIAKQLHLSRETVIDIVTRHGKEVYVKGGTKGREHRIPCVLCGYPVRGCTLAQHMQSHREGGWRNLQEIADMYQPGVSLRALGEHFHLGAQHVKHMLMFYGVPIRAYVNQHTDSVVSEEERERICEMYDSGFSMFKVTKHLHVSRHLVRKVLFDRYVEEVMVQVAREPTPARRVLYYLKALESEDPIRPRTSYSTDRLTQDEIAKTVYLYRDKKLTLREVGRILGVRGHTVHWRLTRAGVPTRTRKENALMRASA